MKRGVSKQLIASTIARGNHTLSVSAEPCKNLLPRGIQPNNAQNAESEKVTDNNCYLY